MGVSSRRMGTGYEQVNFRLPTALRDRLREAADSNNRSVTAELVHRLESSFEPSVPPHFEEALKLVVTNAIEAGILAVTDISAKEAKENAARAKRRRELVATNKGKEKS